MSDLEGFVHSHLHLSHVQHIGESNDFDEPIAVTIIFPVAAVPLLLPEIGDPSTPLIDIHDNKVLVLLDVDFLTIDFQGEDVAEMEVLIFIFEDI